MGMTFMYCTCQFVRICRFPGPLCLLQHCLAHMELNNIPSSLHKPVHEVPLVRRERASHPLEFAAKHPQLRPEHSVRCTTIRSCNPRKITWVNRILAVEPLLEVNRGRDG